MNYLYSKTEEKKQHIEPKVDKYIEIWEHEWDELAKTSELRDFIKNQDLKTSLKPRSALYGGRTNNAMGCWCI
jgi:hypothetical protein